MNSFIILTVSIILEDITVTSRYLNNANIKKEPSHRGNHLFELLASGQRHRSHRAPTNRLRDSFFPRVITMNHRTVESRHNNQSEWNKPISVNLYLQCTKPEEIHICYSFVHCTTGHCSFLILLVFIVCSHPMTTKASDSGSGSDYSKH